MCMFVQISMCSCIVASYCGNLNRTVIAVFGNTMCTQELVPEGTVCTYPCETGKIQIK